MPCKKHLIKLNHRDTAKGLFSFLLLRVISYFLDLFRAIIPYEEVIFHFEGFILITQQLSQFTRAHTFPKKTFSDIQFFIANYQQTVRLKSSRLTLPIACECIKHFCALSILIRQFHK